MHFVKFIVQTVILPLLFPQNDNEDIIEIKYLLMQNQLGPFLSIHFFSKFR